MTNHITDTRNGVVASLDLPYVDMRYEQNGVIYTGRLYPEQAEDHVLSHVERKPLQCERHGRPIAFYDRQALYLWCRFCKKEYRVAKAEVLHLFGVA